MHMNLESKKLLTTLSKVIFIIYLIIMLWVVIFKCNIYSSLNDGYQYLKTLSVKERFLFYIVPFENYTSNFSLLLLSDSILNLLLFMPLGLYLAYFCKKNKFLNVLFISFVICISIELFQLFSIIGSFQTEDLILNFSGSLIGYLIFLLIYPTLNKPKSLKTLNICSIIAITIFLPITIYAIYNTINNFQIYIEIITRQL